MTLGNWIIYQNGKEIGRIKGGTPPGDEVKEYLEQKDFLPRRDELKPASPLSTGKF